jgi:hypothetical protein
MIVLLYDRQTDVNVLRRESGDNRHRSSSSLKKRYAIALPVLHALDNAGEATYPGVRTNTATNRGG